MKTLTFAIFLLAIFSISQVTGALSQTVDNTGTIFAATLNPSWNPAVTCGPARVTTLQEILGLKYPSQSFMGSFYETGFNPSVTTQPGYGGIGFPDNSTDAGAKRNLSPLCQYTGLNGTFYAFVEIDNLWIATNMTGNDVSGGFHIEKDCHPFSNGTFCDNTGNIYETQQLGFSCSGTGSPPVNYVAFHPVGCIHGEMDWNWFANGQIGTNTLYSVTTCTALTFCDNATLMTNLGTSTQMCTPAGKPAVQCVNIDIQGFVYWDGLCSGMNQCPWHWEIHPWTAWRMHT